MLFIRPFGSAQGRQAGKKNPALPCGALKWAGRTKKVDVNPALPGGAFKWAGRTKRVDVNPTLLLSTSSGQAGGASCPPAVRNHIPKQSRPRLQRPASLRPNSPRQNHCLLRRPTLRLTSDEFDFNFFEGFAFGFGQAVFDEAEAGGGAVNKNGFSRSRKPVSLPEQGSNLRPSG